jgi:hypothetical protein
MLPGGRCKVQVEIEKQGSWRIMDIEEPWYRACRHVKTLHGSNRSKRILGMVRARHTTGNGDP